jgi:hypothetical protein
MRPSSMGLAGTFVLAAVATFTVTANVYGDLSHPTLLTAELLSLLALHALRYLHLWISREMLLYVGFVGYSLLSLAWTDDVRTAVITLPALINFALMLLLFSALVAYHDLRALLAGMVVGFTAAAVRYTLTSGFPFSYPDDFSYNTIAGMYLFGLFITAVFGAYTHRLVLPLAAGAILMLLIMATTSIKTNLGVALGISAAAVLYFKPTLKGIVRGVVVLVILTVGGAYTISSNPALVERVQNGFGRVSRGVSVLANREADSGSTGLGNRKGWEREGLRGWAATPVFGHGFEGFRADFGTTSHSTPIDLLYNSGIIGFGLFYGMFASIAWRLLRSRNAQFRGVRARIAACLIAYSFMSLSGTLYYDTFVAIFVGVAAGLLMRLERSGYRASESAGVATMGVDGPVPST